MNLNGTTMRSLLLLLPLWLGAAETTAPAPVITFPTHTQVQLGNVFTLGERVEVVAAVTGAGNMDWQVTDFIGAKVDAGTATVADGAVRIAPRITGKGYYGVSFTVKAGGVIRGEGSTSVAVVPRFDLAAMAGSRFGVMTHFAQNMPVDFLPLLTKAGIAHVRDEQYWASVEKAPGKFRYPPNLQGYMDALKPARITPLMVMSFGNPIHGQQKGVPNHKLAPWNTATYDAYATYCVDVLKHYGDQIQVAEIWNEYNGTFCAGEAAKDRPKTYNEMLKVAYAKIKAARPEVTVLGAATVKIPLPYLDKLFKHGALAHMDALAVHPYMSPDEAETALAKLSEMVKAHNHGASKPIWCTELGFHSDHSPGRSEAAKHLVRMLTCLLTSPDVARIYWYLARDYPPQFAAMGLLRHQQDPMGSLTPVIPYVAYANLIDQFQDARIVVREPADVRTRLYQFASTKQRFWVGWSEVETASLEITTSAPVTLVDIVGGETVLTPVGGKVILALDEDPVYIVTKAGVTAAVRELPRSDRVVIDSDRAFGGPGVSTDWSYHFCANTKNGDGPYDPDRLQPMTWAPSPGDWADTWTGPGKWFTLGAKDGQVGVIDGGQGWAVRRWTSTLDGSYRILAKLRTSGKGDGCGFKLFVDGVEKDAQLLPANATGSIDLTLELKHGMRLDFIITPGPGTDVNYDSAGCHIQILTPTKPR